MTVRYPRARPTPLDAPHWEGLREGKLLVQRCVTCGTFQWFPRPVCSTCMSEALDWTEIGTTGTVFTYTVTHQRTGFAFDEDAPFVAAVVQMDDAEGVRMLGVLHLEDPGSVHVGMRVRGEVRSRGDDNEPALDFVALS